MRLQVLAIFVLLIQIIHALPYHVRSSSKPDWKRHKNATQTLADAINAMFPSDAVFRLKLEQLYDEEYGKVATSPASKMLDAAKSIRYDASGIDSRRTRYGSNSRSQVAGGRYSGLGYRSVTLPPVYPYGGVSDGFAGKHNIDRLCTASLP
jgi:hypothetical protein